MKNIFILLCEGIGTLFLIMIIVGSGIMAQKLSIGFEAVALLGNTIATGAGLFVLIKIFGNISGAHFNPIVSFVFLLRKELSLFLFISYSFIQIIFAILGVWLCHIIFEVDILQISNKWRGSFPLLVSEIIATFGLMTTILFVRHNDKSSIAIAVALFITAGYWFTSSTSFANPAVTIARSLTDTFTGIAPSNIPFFVVGQGIGSILAFLFFQSFEKFEKIKK